MPFKEIYSVNFANGNLQPHLKPKGERGEEDDWPDMQEIVPADSERRPDAEGLNISIIKRPSFAGNLAYVIQVVPPNSLTLERRLLTRVTFDLPRAEKFHSGLVDAELGVASSRQSQYATSEAVGSSTQEFSKSTVGIPDVGIGGVRGLDSTPESVPELWAVGLTMRPPDDTLGEAVVRVTCQFNREVNGVRLNAPRPLGATVGPIQTDQSTILDGPLDYNRYNGGIHENLDGSTSAIPPDLFTLEHSFCGVATTADRYTVGAGFLTIHHPIGLGRPLDLRDHRLYSSDALTPSPQNPLTIGALAVTLGTGTAGRMSVRLRTFSVWENSPPA